LLKNIGLAYKMQVHLEESIRYLTDGLNLLEKYKGKNNIEAAESYFEIGSIYDATNSIELAQTYYLAAIQLC
jgi:tetratricopeptide (TPR) repeat protein